MTATLSDLDVFHPEAIKTMFLEVEPPETTYRQLFRNPVDFGLYSFSMGSFDDPFAILPPVNNLEDAKSMMAEQEVESYTLQAYRGFVDIDNTLIKQFQNASNMKGLITAMRERYAMVLRQGFENTMEYTCYNAMADAASTLSTSHDWTSSSTTADHIIEDLVKARKAYMDNTRRKPTVCIVNPEAEAQMLLRKDLSNQLYGLSPSMLMTGEINNPLRMKFMTQIGGYTDYEGEELTMFQPSTANKNLAYIFDPNSLGYPVICGAPEFNAVDNHSKDSVRIYVKAYTGFVFNKKRVDEITY